MTDLSIQFRAPMIRALLDGRKTMTRRKAWRFTNKGAPDSEDLLKVPTKWQKVQPGDRLFVKENWRTTHQMDQWSPKEIADKCLDAGYSQAWAPIQFEGDFARTGKWAPEDKLGRFRGAIHMPKWASRLTLIVTAVRIERVQEISESDALAEGMDAPYLGDCDPPWEGQAGMIGSAQQFRNLWYEIHSKESWNANPEVIVISFDVVKENIDKLRTDVSDLVRAS